MQPSRLSCPLPLRCAAVGASLLAPAAAALAAKPAQAAPSTTPQQGLDPSASGSGGSAPGLRAHAVRARIAYGQRAVVVGRVSGAQVGETVTLQFTPIGSGDWRQVAAAPVHADGRFRLSAWLARSGWLRVSAATPSSNPMNPPAAAAGASASAPQRVAVAAAVRVRPRTIAVFGQRTVSLSGRLLPAVPWRRVLLQGERDGRWRTLASARTTRGGWFALRYRAAGVGREPLRVSFAGDRRNAAGSGRAGALIGYEQTVASWYEDGGSTACGFHAYYGVANLSLPCGTPVDFEYNGRRVQAVVDDRGPYVGGRTWDLNQNTAAALGFGGVGAVWSSP